jgi:hypothetical protein
MSEKYLRRKLKKIKKKWPSKLRPLFMPGGEIRFVRSFSADTLLSHGIKNVEDLTDKMKVLESSLVTPKENEIVEEFVALVNLITDSLPVCVAFSIFEEFFPGIFDELE